MTSEKLKPSKTRLKPCESIEQLRRKSTDYLFQPITSANDLSQQRKPPSPFQTGLRYLKFLGQIKRSRNEIPSFKSPILERTSAFSTNYYAPLPPLSSSHSINRSIQVDDDFDDLSYHTARDPHPISSLSFYEYFFTLFSILFFLTIVVLMQFSSHPLHCFFHKKFWSPIELSDGFHCETSPIEIHYVEISSLIYQIELRRNFHAFNCLGFDLLSCFPIDYSFVPKGRIIRRNDQLIHYCNRTQSTMINCRNQSLLIGPFQSKWNLKNYNDTELFHCSCLEQSNRSRCFHLMLTDRCDLQIPWFDYCLKYSTTYSTCQAYVLR